jgi:hypothetical protein
VKNPVPAGNFEGFVPNAANPPASLCSMIFQFPRFGLGAVQRPTIVRLPLGGQVQVDFATLPPSIEYIRAGRLRALAVTTATRSEALPENPYLGGLRPRL